MKRHIVLSAALYCAFALFCFASLAVSKPLDSMESSITTVDTVIRIAPNPQLGFNYPYFLRIPKGLNKSVIQHLLVETNNSGVNDTLSHHEREAYLETIQNSFGSSICSGLRVPFLVPVFPRPAKNWKVYTHALDRDAAMIKSGEMKRLDLQLIAMIEHARSVLKGYSISIKEKILLNGFSASASFANRFTLIHPKLVAGTACGGINSMPILCIPKWKNTALKFPIGTYDFEQLFGEKFDLSAFREVPQYIYMGQNDDNDAVLFDDAYSKSERKTIFKLLGKTMIPDRFDKCKSVYAQNNVNCTFRVYAGIGHETDQIVYNDVIDFFSKIMKNK